jgi:hypothetical protein
VFHDCTEGHIVKGVPGELERVPAHKSLLRCEPHKGLPIGNLNSQFFANVYLNGLDHLDQLVKHALKCRHYIRYCDDFVLLSPDRDQLVAWRSKIEDYLREALALELNPRERLRPVSDGIDFLGYIVRRDYRLVRRRVVNACKVRLRAYRELLVSEHEGTVTYRFDASEFDRLRATLSSYLGPFRRANAYKLWQSIWQGQDWLAVYFDWDAQRQRLVPRYAMPKGLTNVRQQYAWVRGLFPGDVALFQVGAYYELYDHRDGPIAAELGLKPLKENRRRALYGMPQRLFGRYLARLLGLGRSVVVVRQGEQQWTGIRERALAWRMVPAAARLRLALQEAGEPKADNARWSALSSGHPIEKQLPENVRALVRDPDQRQGGPARLAPTLLPLLERTHGDPEQLGKLALRHLHAVAGDGHRAVNGCSFAGLHLAQGFE